MNFEGLEAQGIDKYLVNCVSRLIKDFAVSHLSRKSNIGDILLSSKKKMEPCTVKGAFIPASSMITDR